MLGAQISKDKTDLQAATFNTNSGKRLLGLGDLEGAISQFRAAIDLVPTYAPAHFHLAEALQRKGETEEARQEFQRAAELDPQAEASAAVSSGQWPVVSGSLQLRSDRCPLPTDRLRLPVRKATISDSTGTPRVTLTRSTASNGLNSPVSDNLEPGQ